MYSLCRSLDWGVQITEKTGLDYVWFGLDRAADFDEIQLVPHHCQIEVFLGLGLTAPEPTAEFYEKTFDVALECVALEPSGHDPYQFSPSLLRDASVRGFGVPSLSPIMRV